MKSRLDSAPTNMYIFMSMDAEARSALAVIRRCVATDRYRLLVHFRQRLAERGLVWPDVLAVVDAPSDVRPGGPESLGRPKWLVSGIAGDGRPIEFVCVLDEDEQGQITLFVTIYEDR